jgi:tetratricopeptide (TPR) repeat protein
VAELARGSIADRPWGRTFATLGLRGVTGQLTVVADGRRFLVVFDQGAVVAAWSPLASDAAVRVALTSHLVSSSQVPEISRRQAAAPERDEVELIAELARLGPDHALRLRRRVIAQRAARTFSVNHGEFVVTAAAELAILPGCELDVRAVVYLGARVNLSEQRLADELDQLGAWFQLKSGIDDDLPQFGFSDVEQPVVERLRDGGTLAEIDAFASTFVDGRTVRAVIYALASCNACEIEAPPGQPRSRTPSRAVPSGFDATQPLSALAEATQPMAPMVEATDPAARAMTPIAGPAAPPEPPLRRAPTPPGQRPLSPEPPLRRAPTPPGQRPLSADESLRRAPTPPGSPPIARSAPAKPATMPLGPARTVSPPPIPDAAPTKQRTQIPTLSPSPTLASGSATIRPTEDPLDSAPTRDLEAARGRSTDDAVGWDSIGSSPRATTRDAIGRDRSATSGQIKLPPDEAQKVRSGPIRLPDDAQEAQKVRSGPIRLPDDAQQPRSGPIRLPSDDAMRSGSSSGQIRLPSDDALRDGSNPAVRRSAEDSRRRPSSSPGLRRPIERGEAGPGLVTRQVVSSRPPPTRQIARVDTPQSHGVKALIAQRLKLLDQGADHFQLLGVAQDVPADALRKAYFALARQLHPDRLAALGISDDGRHAQRLFAQINAGFAILSDHGRRARYVDVLRRGGEAAVRAEQARAEEMARRILEAEEAFRRGELAMRRDQPQAAVVELERAVQLNPEEADYHASLAWAKFCAAPDRPAAAPATRTALERAIQGAPRSVTARFYLGRVERMLGRDQDALRHFRDVLASVPGHADAAAEVRALEARLTGGDKPSGIFGSRPPPKR